MGRAATRNSETPMADLLIVGVPGRHIIAGNFGAEIRGGRLMLAAELAELLRRHDIRTAAEFVSLLRAFPSGMAVELGWSLENVQYATRCLVRDLVGVLPSHALETFDPPELVYGARKPR